MLVDDSLLLEDYRIHQIARGLRPHSITQVGHLLAAASRWLIHNRGRSLCQAEGPDLTAYLAWKLQSIKSGSAREIWTAMSGLYKWRLETAEAPSPMAKVPRPRIDIALPRFAGEAEVVEFLRSWCDWTWHGARDRAFSQLLYESGMRVGEAAGLNLDDLDLPRRQALLRVTKGHRERVALFGDQTVRWLSRWIDQRGMIAAKSRSLWISGDGSTPSASWWSAHIAAQGRACNPRNPITAHRLRHSFATHLLSRGADMRTLQDLLGHASIETTMRYAAVMPAHRREVRDLLPSAA